MNEAGAFFKIFGLGIFAAAFGDNGEQIMQLGFNK
jgi:hypothetical protein